MSNKPKAHFYLASCAMWCTTGLKYTLPEAIRIMDKEKLTYLIWYVPCEAGVEYEINYYAPQVEGAHIVELVEFKNGKRVKSTTKE